MKSLLDNEYTLQCTSKNTDYEIVCVSACVETMRQSICNDKYECRNSYSNISYLYIFLHFLKLPLLIRQYHCKPF